jgi:hypothetical protein
MARTITAAALCVGLLAMPLSVGFAQTMSTPVDRVLRPGDTIQWVPTAPHYLQLVHRFDEIDHMGVGFIFAETTCSLTA